jgi:tetratricopeptide (TPR) repeat protein
MTKLIYLTVIIAVACLLIACGGNTSEKNLYNLEKFQSKAVDAEERVFIKPELASAEDIQEIILKYQEVIDNFQAMYPDLKDKDDLSEDEMMAANLAGTCQLKVGQLNMMAGETAAAKESFADFEILFPKNIMQQKMAWLALSEIFDQEQKWEKVENIYLKLIETYDPPATREFIPTMDILKLPYDMLVFFMRKGDEAKIAHYAVFAENYYKRLADTYPKTNLYNGATRYLAETYKLNGKSEQAIETLTSVVDAEGQITNAALILTAQTYFENMHEPDKAIEYYKILLARESDTLYTPTSLMEMGQILLLERRFSEARETLNKLIKKHEYATSLHPQAYRMIAISYEEEKNYEQALNSYLALIENFTTHSATFDTYLYLPDFFAKQDKKQLRDQWYNRAEGFFVDMRDKYELDALGAVSQEYLARFYMKYEVWRDATLALNRLVDQFSGYKFALDAYARIGAIYEIQLKMLDSAKFYYNKQADAYPDITVSRTAKEKANNL